MEKHSKLYTKTGDLGETSLVDGSRVLKSDQRLDLYGDIDELSCLIGKAISTISQQEGGEHEQKTMQVIQSALFDLGSLLACPEEKHNKYQLPGITLQLSELVEREIDRLDQMLPSLDRFILPGGTSAAADLHLCRAVTRRAERKFVKFSLNLNNPSCYQAAIIFINRLSDYFFILARVLNHRLGCSEIEWQQSAYTHSD
ncbi:MAG: cob(I)yrinic acid a,c-diamide adenosyltransferase [Bdellovibrionales bacterium]|jgi:cob(I)alamin adenosyltransferase|nr:cob(I)yrinic acid a,c-diamide adenosyltransferase [Bdellovibrionales bacterium]MBT3525310.1 cob(I)yrinic acid a,c-diamide adenosyltransferase [Bdellovibrionales bacterium]MBT7668543.1 cob(I)yrinic acid a,c-diamide adenosyltransferase [Bdellovibrionales bacterium]MBT7766148.1 cob(I)yrinic acid a,c-diamide adenosyltransferase [Bdellovibrionales bacterium]